MRIQTTKKTSSKTGSRKAPVFCLSSIGKMTAGIGATDSVWATQTCFLTPAWIPGFDRIFYWNFLGTQ